MNFILHPYILQLDLTMLSFPNVIFCNKKNASSLECKLDSIKSLFVYVFVCLFVSEETAPSGPGFPHSRGF